MKRRKLFSFVCTVVCVLSIILSGCGNKVASEYAVIGADTQTQINEVTTVENVESTETVQTTEVTTEEKTQETTKEETAKEETAGTNLQTQEEQSVENTTEEVVEVEQITKPNDSMGAVTAANIVAQMNIGWNLGNTLDATHGGYPKNSDPEKWETCWGNPVTTEQLIKTVIDKGFNVIRIPVSWNDHYVPGSDFVIVESWMNRVQEVVDYAYNNGAYVIINAHHESWYYPYYDNEARASYILERTWTQIAERFKDYDEHLIFEGMNEPRKVGTALEWNGGDKEGWDMVNAFNKVFVDTVRKSDGFNPNRILMISNYGGNCWDATKYIIVPEDDKIIVTVHAYEPYNFALNKTGTAVWDNNTKNIDMIMKNMNDRFVSKGIPVVIGEFGAMTKNEAANNEQERAAWAEYYVRAAKKVGIPCVWWDNGAFSGDGELFGLINRKTYEWKYPVLLEGLFKGLED